MNGKPKCCDEPNCECIYGPGKEFTTEEPYSNWCFGVRTGIIKGKEKAMVTTPSDVFVECLLIGSHSEAQGRHCFVTNVADAYLDLRSRLFKWKRSGMLERNIKSVFNMIPEEIIQDFADAIDYYYQQKKYPHSIDIGTKFIEFGCDCGEIFFREWNHHQVNGIYYRPTKQDEKLFEYHRKLGHEIRYHKCKRVRKSSKGSNPFWQDWGWHPWK